MARFDPSLRKAPPVNLDLGPAIRERRHELGLTQVQLARRIGRSTVMLKFIEQGKRQPSTTTLRMLTKMLGRDFMEFAHVPVPDEPVPYLPVHDSPREPPSVVGGCVRPGAVIGGRTVAQWLQHDAEARAQADAPPARPGLYFVGWRTANR